MRRPGEERGGRPWMTLLLPPFAWIGFEYGLASWLRVSCTIVGSWLGPAWGGASLLVCLAAAALAWPMARRATGDDPGARPWLARIAMLAAGVFALAIAYQTLATLIVPSCVR